jgi:hypothetical protein
MRGDRFFVMATDAWLTREGVEVMQSELGRLEDYDGTYSSIDEDSPDRRDFDDRREVWVGIHMPSVTTAVDSEDDYDRWDIWKTGRGFFFTFFYCFQWNDAISLPRTRKGSSAPVMF